MPKIKREPGWSVVNDDRLSDTEKIAALQRMLTEERAAGKRRRLRMSRTLTAITKEWQDMFDEFVPRG